MTKLQIIQAIDLIGGACIASVVESIYYDVLCNNLFSNIFKKFKSFPIEQVDVNEFKRV